jgi:putative membrane protein
MLSLAAVSIAWEPHPDVWLLIVALTGGYLYALAAWGPKARPGRPAATRSQRTCFFLGVAALWIGADWPIHTIAENYLYSVHMFQHLIFQLVAAPLLLLGMPAWLLRKLLAPPLLHATVAAITKPIPAIVLVSGFTAVMHVPVVVDTVATNGLLHLGAHIALMIFSFIMWWPVLSPLPELPHLSYPGAWATCSPTRSCRPCRRASSPSPTSRCTGLRGAEAGAWLTANEDLQIAGLIMKIGGGLLIWGVIAVLFFRWSFEESSGSPDFLYWRDVEPDVDPRTLSTT